MRCASSEVVLGEDNQKNGAGREPLFEEALEGVLTRSHGGIDGCDLLGVGVDTDDDLEVRHVFARDRGLGCAGNDRSPCAKLVHEVVDASLHHECQHTEVPRGFPELSGTPARLGANSVAYVGRHAASVVPHHHVEGSDATGVVGGLSQGLDPLDREPSGLPLDLGQGYGRGVASVSQGRAPPQQGGCGDIDEEQRDPEQRQRCARRKRPLGGLHHVSSTMSSATRRTMMMVPALITMTSPPRYCISSFVSRCE